MYDRGCSAILSGGASFVFVRLIGKFLCDLGKSPWSFQEIMLFLQRKTFLKMKITMRKVLVLSLSAVLFLSSCSSFKAAGAYTGAHFGSAIGSAIGGLSGGWRGSDVGTLIGMAGGAMVGAAIGAAAENAVVNRLRDVNRNGEYAQQAERDSGYDPQGRGDDRISFDNGMSGDYAAPSALRINNVQMLDASQDGKLTRGESAHVVFEILNTSLSPVYDVQPSVREVSGNKHIHISENILVECIRPGETIRYTAQVKADNGLRNGEAVISVSMFQAGSEVSSQTRQLRIPTLKR